MYKRSTIWETSGLDSMGILFLLSMGHIFLAYLVIFFCIQIIVNDTLQRFWLCNLPLKGVDFCYSLELTWLI